MNDQQTTVAALRQLVQEFVDQRGWRKFHTPKNLSMALSVEAAELMEHFQWLSPSQAAQVAEDPQRSAAVGEELADVLCYSLALANALSLDVTAIVRNKMAKNELKYPVDQFHGRFGPDDPGDA